ncbi:Putative homogentisate phytyltransferase 1, chloroplastic [Glycine soja]|uniref:Putative homogentisate phytyltransferase 1, chloroplastic n=1 Tax=Glycine soja TaxID=3848 RepID=A0A0B2NUG3_GLYSO|nr:Putative homogentisate phytyltransferase 1, chloroplastic [Glycine soja]
MDRALVMSSPNVCSVTNGGNLWRRKHSTNNYNYPSLQQKRKTQIEYNILRSQSLNHHYKCIEGGRTYQESNIKYVVKAAPAIPSFGSESHASSPKNIFDSVKNFLAILYNFCYPYTMIGRTLCTISASLLAVEKISDISPLFFIGLSQVLVAHFFMDLYINGVNQVFDFEIDKTFVFKRPVIFPRSLIVTIVFSSLYAIGIALSKDIPDIEGDKKFGIHSFSARLGQKQGLGNVILASILWYQTKYVDLTSPASTRSFYMLIWKVFLQLCGNFMCINVEVDDV